MTDASASYISTWLIRSLPPPRAGVNNFYRSLLEGRPTNFLSFDADFEAAPFANHFSLSFLSFFFFMRWFLSLFVYSYQVRLIFNPYLFRDEYLMHFSRSISCCYILAGRVGNYKKSKIDCCMLDKAKKGLIFVRILNVPFLTMKIVPEIPQNMWLLIYI